MTQNYCDTATLPGRNKERPRDDYPAQWNASVASPQLVAAARKLSHHFVVL